FLSEAEALALLGELTPDRAARVAFLVATGARWSESDSARLADISLLEGFVQLRGTKTAKSRRTVPLSGHGFVLLDHALRYAEGTDGLLFRPWGNSRRDLAQACDRAGIEKVTANDLRRTYATWLRQAGVAPH